MKTRISNFIKMFSVLCTFAGFSAPQTILAQTTDLANLQPSLSTEQSCSSTNQAQEGVGIVTVQGLEIPESARLTAYCVANVYAIHGRWTPLDNTNNFDYIVVKPGADYYKNRNNGRAVATTCKNNEGSVVVDHNPTTGKDACLYTPIEKLASCNGGTMQINGNSATCAFPVHGRWNLGDNVSNFDYLVVKPGADYYKNRNNGRAVATKCENGQGNVVVDYNSANGRDACVRPVTCGTGYSLVIR